MLPGIPIFTVLYDILHKMIFVYIYWQVLVFPISYISYIKSGLYL